MEASWYSRFMVPGAGPAKDRIVAKAAKLTKMPRAVYRATLRPSSAAGAARGPWGPKAIQYAVDKMSVGDDFKYVFCEWLELSSGAHYSAQGIQL